MAMNSTTLSTNWPQNYCKSILSIVLKNFEKKRFYSLQKQHIPSDGSDSSNSHIHHLHGSKLASKTNKTIKVTVQLEGVHTVSVESNGRVVNVSSTLGVGSVAVFMVAKEDIKEYGLSTVDELDKEVDKTMDKMEAECKQRFYVFVIN